MITVVIDRHRISRHFKSKVSVTSDVPIRAYEARAAVTGQPYGKGIGYDLLGDDLSLTNGVVELAKAVTSFSFDVESAELAADGDYRICVYVRDEDGVWNDCCQLYTSSSETVIDSRGDYVLIKRAGNGTDTSYKSLFSGNDIDNFIAEVLYV